MSFKKLAFKGVYILSDFSMTPNLLPILEKYFCDESDTLCDICLQKSLPPPTVLHSASVNRIGGRRHLGHMSKCHAWTGVAGAMFSPCTPWILHGFLGLRFRLLGFQGPSIVRTSKWNPGAQKGRFHHHSECSTLYEAFRKGAKLSGNNKGMVSWQSLLGKCIHDTKVPL